MFIPTPGYHRAIGTKTDGVRISGVYRHMDIACRNRHDVAPFAHLALTASIVPRGNDRAVRFESNGMTAPRRQDMPFERERNHNLNSSKETSLQTYKRCADFKCCTNIKRRTPRQDKRTEAQNAVKSSLPATFPEMKMLPS
jgi:hypothetical protein